MNPTGRIPTQRFETLANFRDIGGLKTKDGVIMKTGVLFRSDNLSGLTDKDKSIIQTLNIKVICDLRTPKESHKKPSPFAQKEGIKMVKIPLHQQETHDISRKQLMRFLFSRLGGEEFQEFSKGYYQHIAFERTSHIKDIVSLISQEDHVPALIHCTAGKDRTGYISALIQLLVGIPYETVVQDYLMTNCLYETRMEKLIKAMRWLTLFQVSPDRIKLILMAKREVLDEVFDNILREYGSIETYLCEVCGIKQSMLEKLKNMLLK